MTDLIERLRDAAGSDDYCPEEVDDLLTEAADALARLSPEGDWETTEEERANWLAVATKITNGRGFGWILADVAAARLIRDLSRAKARIGEAEARAEAAEKALRETYVAQVKPSVDFSLRETGFADGWRHGVQDFRAVLRATLYSKEDQP